MSPSGSTIAQSGARVAGHRLAVYRAGRGRPVLLLHGIPTSAALWRHVQPGLAAHADTIALDLFGYGRSDKPVTPAPSLPYQVTLLAALIERWDLREVLVVGHDIGGGIAQLLALRSPERVTGLVLIDSIAYDSFPEPTIERLKEPCWDQRIMDVDLAAGLQRSLSRGLTDPASASPELAAGYATPFDGPGGRAAYLRAARALHTGDLADAMPEVEKLAIPVHILWGRNDPFQPLSYGRRLADALPNASLTVLDNGSHFLPEDHPKEVTHEILQALSGSR